MTAVTLHKKQRRTGKEVAVEEKSWLLSPAAGQIWAEGGGGEEREGSGVRATG